MKTTILISTQRSGTTFFDRKISGMYGFSSQGGEFLNKQNFERHNSSHLLKAYSECSPSIRGQKNIKTLWVDSGYFVKMNKGLLPKIVSNSDRPIFNIQYNFIDDNVKYLENVNTPIIHLIRQDSWRRAISEHIMKNNSFPPHVTNITNQNPKTVSINKDKLIKEASKKFDHVLYFQDKLKDKSNVMTLYYEDISRKEYWTDDFIEKLESFMGQKFTNKEYQPPHMKASKFITITNEAEVLREEYTKKYYINKI